MTESRLFPAWELFAKCKKPKKRDFEKNFVQKMANHIHLVNAPYSTCEQDAKKNQKQSKTKHNENDHRFCFHYSQVATKQINY